MAYSGMDAVFDDTCSNLINLIKTDPEPAATG